MNHQSRTMPCQFHDVVVGGHEESILLALRHCGKGKLSFFFRGEQADFRRIHRRDHRAAMVDESVKPGLHGKPPQGLVHGFPGDGADNVPRTGAIVHGPIPLPTKIRKFTLNRSTFVHKDARDQFEMRIHRRLIDLTETTFKTVDSLQNLSLPSGVDIEIRMG